MDKESKQAGAGTVETTGQGVETTVHVAPSEQKSLEDLLKEKNDRIVKLEDQVTNLNRGIKLAKGKVVEEEEEETLDAREIARQEAIAVLAESELAKVTQERDQVLAAVVKENKELRLAFQNRAGTGVSVGSNQDSPAPKDNVISEAQERELRGKGFTDDMIERFKSLSRQ